MNNTTIASINKPRKSIPSVKLTGQVLEDTLLMHLGNRPILFSTLLKKTKPYWANVFTPARLLKILNVFAERGIVQMEARQNLDFIIKPINNPRRE